ncbi:MAG: hypothetical protein WDN00_18795 [Limisphaerales bacterium]
MKVTEYRTAGGRTVEQLDASVNEFIKEGFQPYGGPYYLHLENSRDVSICQAMIKVSELHQQKPKLESAPLVKTPATESS